MKKKMIIISAFLVLIDQVIKFIIRKTMTYQVECFIIPNFFYLTYSKNTGGGFSILENNPLFLALISIVFLLFLFFYLNKKNVFSKIEIAAYSLLIGGISGNLIDRIFFRSVTDYIGIKFGNYYYPIFNLADIFIVLGVLIILYVEFRGEKYGISSK